MDTSLLDLLSKRSLAWFPELDVGWFPVQESPYDRAYWDRYRKMDQTETGAKLTAARSALVSRHWDGPIVDIGIGGGRFVSEHLGARGYDINPDAVAWLKDQGGWHDPYAEPIDAACFWDSLEHIHNPTPLLKNIRRYAFVSVPLFNDAVHVLRSKHFRQDEHCWYFTHRGLTTFMAIHGFRIVETNRMEEKLGREDIATYVFRKDAPR